MDWLEAYAEALGVPALAPEERTAVLRLAREVAHRTERLNAPLAAFLAGRAAAAGEPAHQAFRLADESLPPADRS